MEINLEELRLLYESNRIENELSAQALVDAAEAFSYACDNLKNLYTYAYVLDLHRLLAQHLRPDIAGQLRNCDVFIGGKRKRFVSSTLLREEVEAWCAKSRHALAEIPLDQAAEAIRRLHVEFEELHPFEDFNGRTGRLLLQLQRIDVGLPVEMISADERMEYYKWFREEDN